MLDSNKIKELIGLLSLLSDSNKKFAESLTTQYLKNGYLTSKQEPWVDAMIISAKNSKNTSIVIPNIKKIIDLFIGAKAYLKYPKIMLNCMGNPIILSMAGDNSHYKGSVMINGEGAYPTKTWYGRIRPDGLWTFPTKGLYKVMAEPLQELLIEFGNDPVEVAKKYGKLTGCCAFCNSKLTDVNSVAAGFGPICAGHYGLSEQWKAAVAKAEAKEESALNKDLSGVCEKATSIEVLPIIEPLKDAIVQKIVEDVDALIMGDLKKSYASSEKEHTEQYLEAVAKAVSKMDEGMPECYLCGKKTSTVVLHDGYEICEECYAELEGK